MAKTDSLQKEGISKGNSEDSLLVIYILRILKKYSSPEKPLSSQDVMNYLQSDYSIGSADKSDAQRKKVRRHLDTLCESYWNGCIKKIEGKTRNCHKWYYDVSKDSFSDEDGVSRETLTKEEIDLIVDIITSSKIINSASTIGMVKKLLKKTGCTREEIIARLRKISNEHWPKSINKDLVSTKKTIDSCINEGRKITFDYEDKKSITAAPYGWSADDNGKFILIAKFSYAPEGEFEFFSLEKLQNVQKADLDYSDFDDTYFDRSYSKPDVLSMESLFSNIKIINAAIEEKRGIEFKYLSYAVKDDKVVVDAKDKRVLPHRLVFSDAKYYLIAFDEAQARIDYYRVDLISKPDFSADKIQISDWNAQVLSGVQRAREVEKHPLMLAGTDITVTFKVVESALDTVVDTFAVAPDKFVVTKDTRTVKDSCGDGVHEEKLVKVQVRTTCEEAFRWALANADTVEIDTQDIRDKIARIAEPVYQLYTQSVSDKVRENLDYVLKKGIFRISSVVDADTAYETYKELAKRGKLGIVSNIGITRNETCSAADYIGDFFAAERLFITVPGFRIGEWATRLINVQILELRQIQVDDLSWMAQMKKLMHVTLFDTSVSDLSVLSGHTDIYYLDVSYTNIRDLSFINDYQNLTYLNIVRCPIEDYSPLLTTKSHLKTLEIDKKALEEIGEENIRSRHIGIDIITPDSSSFLDILI